MRALQHCIAPSIVYASDRQQDIGWNYLNTLLAEKLATDKSIVLKIKLLLFLIQLYSLLIHHRRFENLDETIRVDVLKSFRESPLPLFRKGFWGLSTLMKMSAYTLPRVQSQLQYYRNLAVRTDIHDDGT